MSKQATKPFDCVDASRQVRDRISAEIADMSYEELARWIRTRPISDPTLQALANRAGERDKNKSCE